MKKNKKQDDWSDLEIFTSKRAKLKNPKITILERSTFLFNAAFVLQAGITKASYVIIGYSQNQNAITFQFTSDAQVEGAYTITFRTGVASVESRSFFNRFLLKPETLAGHYAPKKVKLPKIGNLWFIDLDNKLPES